MTDMQRFKPVGGNLPPKRGALVEARHAKQDIGESIIVPEARDRIIELFEREQLPGDVASSLGTAITGDIQWQARTVQAMIDTWPRLQKALREVKLAARKAPWKVNPWSARGEGANEQAEALADEVENAIWAMKPDHRRGLKGFEGMVEALADGYFTGHTVIEPTWIRTHEGVRPESARVVPPRFYGYPAHADGEDRLMLDPAGRGMGTYDLQDFPEHRFLIAVNSSHSGHPAVGAPLRCLSAYWLASVYGLRWGMIYAQLFGVPFRWAEYADDKDKAEVSTMLAKIGTAGWAAFKQGTKLNFLDASKGSTTLPQWKLIELADEQCDIFILGQTLTSSVGDSGSRALGEVHMGIRRELIEGVCDFIGEILTHQFVPAWSFWNYRQIRHDLPGIWAEWPEARDEKAMAERDVALGITSGEVPVSSAWFYERHGLPIPGDDDELFRPQANGVQGDLATGIVPPHETEPAVGSIEAAAAALPNPPTIERLTAAVLEGLTGVTQEWLRPVRPFFERLAALAMSKHVTDEDFAKALEDARQQLPELFGDLDSEALEEAFMEAMGSAMLAGSTARLEAE